MNKLNKDKTIAQLEYWLLRPFSVQKNIKTDVVDKIVSMVEQLKDDDSRDDAIVLIQNHLELNKMLYEYVDRYQIKKGIMAMKTSVLKRMLDYKVTPMVKGAMPALNKAFTETVVPTANKALCFLHKVFVKNKDVENNDTENKS